MDPYTGEIIALASSPDFNPSVFVKRANPSLKDLLNNPDAPLINRAINAGYPAGSVLN